MISARVSSTTLRVFEYGALKTATPSAEAAARSIWSVPMQNAPTASRSGARPSTAALSRVLDRMPSSATPGSAAASSASSSADGRSDDLQPGLFEQPDSLGVDVLQEQRLHRARLTAVRSA